MSSKRKAPGGGDGERGGGAAGGSKRKVRFRQKEDIDGEGVSELRKDHHLRFVAVELSGLGSGGCTIVVNVSDRVNTHPPTHSLSSAVIVFVRALGNLSPWVL